MSLSYSQLPTPSQRFSQAQAQQINRHLRMGCIRFKGNNTPVECYLRGHQLPAVTEPVQFSISLPSAYTLSVQVPRALLNVLGNSGSAPSPSDALPISLQLLAVTDQFSTMLAQYEHKWGMRFVPKMLEQHDFSNALPALFKLPKLGTHFMGAICINNDSVLTEQLFEHLATPAETYHDWSLPLHISAGYWFTSRKQLPQQLNVGTVIFPKGIIGNPIHQPLAIYPHYTGRTIVAVRLQWNEDHYVATSDIEYLSKTESVVSSDDIAVTLTFVLSRLNISVSSLNEIQEGYVFDAGKSLSQKANHIDVMLNDKVIAHGELVQVGEHYGVLIHHTV